MDVQALSPNLPFNLGFIKGLCEQKETIHFEACLSIGFIISVSWELLIAFLF